MRKYRFVIRFTLVAIALILLIFAYTRYVIARAEQEQATSGFGNPDVAILMLQLAKGERLPSRGRDDPKPDLSHIHAAPNPVAWPERDFSGDLPAYEALWRDRVPRVQRLTVAVEVDRKEGRVVLLSPTPMLVDYVQFIPEAAARKLIADLTRAADEVKAMGMVQREVDRDQLLELRRRSNLMHGGELR